MSIIEMILTLALTGTLCGVIWFVVVNFSRGGEAEDREGAYYRRLSIMTSRLRADLRTSTHAQMPVSGVIEIVRYGLPSSGIRSESITWWLHEDGRAITRYGEDSMVYDFSDYLDTGKSLVLHLEP